MGNMVDVFFESNEDVLDKLKEVGVISKSKGVESLLNLVYKEVNVNNCIVEHCCTVKGYSYCETPKGSINDVYENLIIEVRGRVFNINIDYFKDMQKKSFSKVGAE